MADILNVPTPLTIKDKKGLLIDNGIALWDVIQSCDIIGSSDASIQNVIPNDLDGILKVSKIERIYANGHKAYDLYQHYCAQTIKMEINLLPSTSPANAKCSLEALVEMWREQIL